MSTKFLDIEKALIAGYQAVGTLVPTGYPGFELTDSDKPDGLWCNIHNVRTISEPVTLGDAGEDNHSGFMQIDINYPVNRGAGEVLIKADELASAFPSGTVLSYNSQNVIVASTTLSPGRYIGGYYRVSLTVNYYSRTFRS